MLQKIIICIVVPAALAFGLISCCSVLRDKKIEENTEEVKDLIKIGDDIFEAQTRLEENGFKITFGPDFPTDSKSYYRMIVDFGLRPNAWEKAKLAAGLPGVDRSLSGIIEADKDGKIYKIE